MHLIVYLACIAFCLFLPRGCSLWLRIFTSQGTKSTSFLMVQRFPLPIRSTRSPEVPDQARPTAVHDFFPTAVRPYTTPHKTTHNSRTTSTRQPPRCLVDYPDPDTISTRSRPDQIDLVVLWSWGIGRLDRVLIGIFFFFYPDQTRSLHDQLDLYSTNTRWLLERLASSSLLEFVDMFKFSGRKPKRCRAR